VIHAQQIRYLDTLRDIINYATVALTSADFVEPTATKHVLYHQLFEELKAIFLKNLQPCPFSVSVLVFYSRRT
jgi:hypothetical protein